MAIIKKIFSTLIIITVLLGAGSIYANVNSAANLSAWYNQSFQKESEKIGAAAGSGIWKILSQDNFSKSNSIKQIGDEQVREANASIEKLANEMNNELNQTVTETKKKDYNLYGENSDIEKQLEQEIENILAEVLGK